MLELQTAPANTLGYFIAGYSVIFGMIGFYLVSLVVRWRNAQQDLQVLSELEPESGRSIK